MPRQLDPRIAEILRKYGEDPTDTKNVLWDCHGTWVVYHAAVERIAARAGVHFDPPQVLRAERDEAVLLVFARLGERAEWDIGECLIGVNYRVAQRQAAYVYAMATKRGRDRVILKLVGLHGLLYSEEEAEEFKDGQPAPAAPPASVTSIRQRQEQKRDDFPGEDAITRNITEALRAKINQAPSIAAVTDLMMSEDTQRSLADLPQEDRDSLRDFAKARLVALGWPGKRAG